MPGDIRLMVVERGAIPPRCWQKGNQKLRMVMLALAHRFGA
jgi:hypothetical protein